MGRRLIGYGHRNQSFDFIKAFGVGKEVYNYMATLF